MVTNNTIEIKFKGFRNLSLGYDVGSATIPHWLSFQCRECICKTEEFLVGTPSLEASKLLLSDAATIGNGINRKVLYDVSRAAF